MTYIEESVGRSVAPAFEALDTDELRAAVRGQLFTPAEDGYEEAARIWNAAHDGRRPALVVRAARVPPT